MDRLRHDAALGYVDLLHDQPETGPPFIKRAFRLVRFTLGVRWS